MSKNLVLIQPVIGDMDMFRGHPTPPIGLLSAASVICAEMEVRIVDQRADKDWRGTLARVLDRDTVAVGVTAMTGEMITYALAGLREARRHSKVPFIWGGLHASLLPEQTVSHELADFVIEGEGEQALAELVRRLAAGRDTGGIAGVWRKTEGGIDHTPRAAMLELDELPPIPYHLVDMERYIQLYDGGKRTLFYQSSRGCPHNCAYCYNTAFNRGRWRAVSAPKALAELAALKERYRLDAVYLWDDNFFIDRDRAMAIVKGVHDLGLRCLLHGADVDSLERLNDADLDFLEANGVDALAIGVESASDRVRADVLKKRGTIAQVRRQLERFKGRGIGMYCFVILGFPTETIDEMKQTIAFALEIMRMGPNFNVERFFNYTPYPGTELYRRVAAGGAKFPASLEEWAAYHWEYSRLYDSRPEIKDFLWRVERVGKFLNLTKDPFVEMNLPMRIMFAIYRPIAWLRMERGWLSFTFEFWLADALKNLKKKKLAPKA